MFRVEQHVERASRAEQDYLVVRCGRVSSVLLCITPYSGQFYVYQYALLELKYTPIGSICTRELPQTDVILKFFC